MSSRTRGSHTPSSPSPYEPLWYRSPSWRRRVLLPIPGPPTIATRMLKRFVRGLARRRQPDQRDHRAGAEVITDVLEAIRLGQIGRGVRRERGAEDACEVEGQRAARVAH